MNCNNPHITANIVLYENTFSNSFISCFVFILNDKTVITTSANDMITGCVMFDDENLTIPGIPFASVYSNVKPDIKRYISPRNIVIISIINPIANLFCFSLFSAFIMNSLFIFGFVFMKFINCLKSQIAPVNSNVWIGVVVAFI